MYNLSGANAKQLIPLLEKAMLDDIMDLELFGLQMDTWDKRFFKIKNVTSGRSIWFDAFDRNNYKQLEYLLPKGADVDQIQKHSKKLVSQSIAMNVAACTNNIDVESFY